MIGLLHAGNQGSDLQIKTDKWFQNHPDSYPHWMTPEEEQRKDEIGRDFYPTDPPIGPVRNIAEFEPMEGVLVRYPFGISYSVIAEMSEDIMVTTIVSGQSQENTVTNYYSSNGVNLDNCIFLHAPTESYWSRDYGPWYVVNGNNEVGIVNFIYNRPRPNDNDIPIEVAEFLDIELYGMNLITAGGNYMTDGMGISAASELVWEENPSQSHAEIAQLLEDFTGVTNFNVIPDPNNTYIDHIDCWGKFLDVDKVLVRSVPTSHNQYDEIEATADYFSNQMSSYGTPYEVYRVYTPQNQPYTNSLILNDKVFVPITGSSWDDDALASYEEAMPGYEVLGFTGSWESTDALHCRAKGVADRGMLYIRHIPLSGEIPSSNGDFEITATVIPYSGASVNNNSPTVFYRVDGGGYQSTVMESIVGNEFSGYIPALPFGGEVAYYIHAADASGRSADHPFIGAPDPHIFQVISTQAEMDLPHLESWNLVGLPLVVTDPGYLNLFPTATENSFFSYSPSGYTPETSFSAGNGYWLHFEEAGTHIILGEPFSEITIELTEGWNLVSGISSSVNADQIIDPNDLIIPNTLFEFQGASGYVYAQSLEPGRGYWIRSFNAGEITITNSNNSQNRNN